jgi:hypothetical protein
MQKLIHVIEANAGVRYEDVGTFKGSRNVSPYLTTNVIP